MNFENVTFTGTAKDFVDCGVKINGRAVDQIAVNTLGKHEILQFAGYGAKPARGRTPTLYKAIPRDGLTIAFNKYPDPPKPVVTSKALDAMVQSVVAASDATGESLTVAELVGAVDESTEQTTDAQSPSEAETQVSTQTVETPDSPF